ncbi:MAG: hypothetical protein WCK53_12965, partial [Methanomicrobiales archaeon]
TKLISRGCFYGGSVTPVAGQLKIDLSPWKLISEDGMVVEETSDTVRLSTPAGQTTVIAVKAVYVQNNNPIIETVALEQSAFNALDPLQYVIMAKVDVPSGSTSLLVTYVDYTERDIVDKLGRNPIRGTLNNSSLLPGSGNQDGDLYIVTEAGTVHFWGWNPLLVLPVSDSTGNSGLFSSQVVKNGVIIF